ncbi:MAG: DUF2807 domain-containing protein [Alphaproteobacteria bacterium]|nr:MAG: DUF2807 domain-containing protein [Alphaproteobacteria bacterium]
MTYTNPRSVALSLIVSASLFALLTCPAQAAEVNETRDVSAFTEISQRGSVDVVVTVGKSQSVTVYADEEDIGRIVTEVKGGELIVRQKKNTDLKFWGRKTGPRVVITVPSLEGFESQGSGDAEIKGLKGDHFDLQQQGSGDVTMAGKVKKAELRSHGSGDLNANAFDADQLNVVSHGSGDISFSGLKSSEAVYSSHGSGDLSISGTCSTFTLDSMGSGDIGAKSFKCKDVNVSSMGSADISIFASGEIEVSIMGSGDVDVYGGGRLTKSRTHGSGDIDIHN